jgi:hypothetical protein
MTTARPTAYADQFDRSVAILTLLEEQPPVEEIPDEWRCDGGKHQLRIRHTPFESLSPADIVEGLLIYRPSPSPLCVYELNSSIFTNENGFRTVKVTAHTRLHAGDDSPIRRRDMRLKAASVIDQFTPLKHPTTKLPTFN